MSAVLMDSVAVVQTVTVTVIAPPGVYGILIALRTSTVHRRECVNASKAGGI